MSNLGETGEANDAALVAAIRSKRPDALAVAYRQHARAVFDLSRCIARDRALAEDVVQDVFVRLWDHPERFEPNRGSLRAYLLTLAYGRSVDVARSETARHRREQRQAQLAAATTAAANEGFDERMAREAALHAALADLPVSERQAIALAYFGGHSYREVAALLEVPEGTIKNRIRTGLTHLRNTLPA